MNNLEVISILAFVVDQALVVHEIQADGGGSRYRLLETVSRFAARKLAESGMEEPSRRAHAMTFAAFALALADDLRSSNAQRAINLVAADIDNLHGALDWHLSDEGEAEKALQIAASLWPYWETRGLILEGRRYLSLALQASPDGDSAIRAEVLMGLGVMAWTRRSVIEARSYLEESLQLSTRAGDRLRRAAALNRIGDVARHAGRLDEAPALHEEALALYTNIHNPVGMADAFMGLANAHRRSGRMNDAATGYREARKLYFKGQNVRGEAWALNGLSLLSEYAGAWLTAQRQLLAALDLFLVVDDRRGLIACLLYTSPSPRDS